MNRNTPSHGQPAPAGARQKLLLAAYADTRKPGDQQVLSDEQLQSAMEGSRHLSKDELAMLMDSPLTLRRLRALAARFEAMTELNSPQVRGAAARAIATAMGHSAGADGHTADADDAWQSSIVQLVGAAGLDDGNFSQTSPDALWTLHAVASQGHTRLVLALQHEHERAAALMAAREQMELAVLDGDGATLMLGRLDDDGTMDTDWLLPGTLRSHLVAHGGKFSVERV